MRKVCQSSSQSASADARPNNYDAFHRIPPGLFKLLRNGHLESNDESEREKIGLLVDDILCFIDPEVMQEKVMSIVVVVRRRDRAREKAPAISEQSAFALCALVGPSILLSLHHHRLCRVASCHIIMAFEQLLTPHTRFVGLFTRQLVQLG